MKPSKGVAAHGLPPLTQPHYWAVAAITIAVITAALVATWRPETPKSSVRVQNASAVALLNVVVGHVSYGNISAGASTEYQLWGPAYPNPRIEFAVNGRLLRHVPIDYVGESVLGQGLYTYIVTMAAPNSTGDFDVVAVKDPTETPQKGSKLGRSSTVP